MSILDDMKQALEVRHARDLLWFEVKDGPSWGSGLGVLDGWAMPKSWAHPDTTGYELKVSRSDYARDDKWPKYLPVCNRFYFVTPKGLVETREVPEGAGLMELRGSRLVRVVLAPRREADPAALETMMRYLLMNRVRPTGVETKGERCARYMRELEHRWALGRIIHEKTARALREADHRAEKAELAARDAASWIKVLDGKVAVSQDLYSERQKLAHAIALLEDVLSKLQEEA